MRTIWFLKMALAALILNWSPAVLSAEKCQGIYRSQSERFTSVLNQITLQFAGRTARNKDQAYFQETRALVHRTAIDFATEPELKSHTNELKASLEKIISERQSAPDHWSDDYLRLLQQMVGFLDLNQSSLADWKSYLLDTHPTLRLQGGTPAFLLRALPESTKAALLEWLGNEYTGSNKRKVTAPIHKLLNPKELYRKMKAEGRSDRQFYNEYLALIKKSAFRNHPEVGGYTGDMVIEIARTIQTYLKSKTEIQAINFFGSVPNGFGTPKSDLDIFNHANKELYPELANDVMNEIRGRGFGPIEKMRYQIDDPVLADMIGKITGSTMWTWHLENHGNLADEHVAAVDHLFSFQITKDKISLRFYDNYVLLDPTSSDRMLHYIDLSID